MEDRFNEHDDSLRANAANYVNPYNFFNKIFSKTPHKANVLFDTGCSIAWDANNYK